MLPALKKIVPFPASFFVTLMIKQLLTLSSHVVGRTDEKSSTENKLSINDDRPESFEKNSGLVSSFCYKSVWNKRAACIGTMQHRWGLGTAQQAF